MRPLPLGARRIVALAVTSFATYGPCGSIRLLGGCSAYFLSTSAKSTRRQWILSPKSGLVGGGGYTTNNNLLKNQRLLRLLSTDTCHQDQSHQSHKDPLSLSTLSWHEELCGPCKSTTSRTVNPHKEAYIDRILQRLNSPAPQSFYVLQRAIHRISTTSDLEMVQTTAFFLVKAGYQLVVYQEDNYAKHCGNLSWEILPKDQDVNAMANDGRTVLLPSPSLLLSNKKKPKSTLQIATQILNVVTEASQQQIPIKVYADSVLDMNLNALVESIHSQLQWTMGMDLRGRTSADAAFVLALAGVTDERIFESLATISYYELMRVGYRTTFESKYVLQIVEKHAAAGTNPQVLKKLYQVAADCLQTKPTETLDDKNNQEQFIKSLQTLSLDLLSPYPLLWLWRFSARQKKVKNKTIRIMDEEEKATTSSTMAMMKRPPVTSPAFQNPHQPLILDLGCGMGTSLLGLATTPKWIDDDDDDAVATMVLGDGVDIQKCNLLGADLSQLAIQFAKGITTRWGLHDRLGYSWSTAEECLDAVVSSSTYTGHIALIMIQFPTPYRLQNHTNIDMSDAPLKNDGNSQLPMDANSGFMVSDSLLAKIAHALSHSGGKLLIQSNCEDVAVTIRHRATTQYGMNVVNVPDVVTTSSMEGATTDEQQTLRNLEWIQMGGERAAGAGWSAKQLLPARGTTETEVACRLQGTPIHRCLLSPP